MLDTQPDASAKAARQYQEADRHQRRLAHINASRMAARRDLDRQQERLREVLEMESRRDLTWATTHPGLNCPP